MWLLFVKTTTHYWHYLGAAVFVKLGSWRFESHFTTSIFMVLFSFQVPFYVLWQVLLVPLSFLNHFMCKLCFTNKLSLPSPTLVLILVSLCETTFGYFCLPCLKQNHSNWTRATFEASVAAAEERGNKWEKKQHKKCQNTDNRNVIDDHK